MNRSYLRVGLIIGMLAPMLLAVSAQSLPAAQPASDGAQNSTFSEAELDQLTAAIALYSDPLIAQILTAATYPLEVVEAHRWLQEPGNAALTGDQLAAALQQQSWDLSVKSVVPFPQVLQMMDANLDWTERIGEAFLAQQDAVMDSIQRLRQRAASAGSLHSTPQQTVSTENEDIAIEPANPDVVYVPYYDPSVIYGPWPWPDESPFFLLPPPGIIIGGGLWIGFGIGFPILGPFWGWNRWDWPHHRLDIVGGGGGPGRTGPWEHDPGHRHGVPYRNGALAARFQDRSESARRDARGFPAAAQGPRAAAPSGYGTAAQPRQTPERTSLPSAHAAPPTFESYGGGSQVRQQSQRGSASRSAPAPRSAPSSRGGGGGRR
jgi:hypothetical protein